MIVGLIEIIEHSEQRYPTTGDWAVAKDELPKPDFAIKVSQMGNWRYEMLVGIHELIEAVLCYNDGVTEESVTNFDLEFEKNRKPGDESEPGDDIRAPYYRQHQIATGIERILAAELGVDWNAYEKANLELYQHGSVRPQEEAT